jgi:hypothetical protein
MISVIICSINPAYLERVKESIGNTIGTGFEILSYDNRNGQLGICAVYNKLASAARYPYLLFVHEDVTFHTQNWGQLLLEGFSKRPDAVAAGVAGSSYKTSYYSGWFTGLQVYDSFNILHQHQQETERLQSPVASSAHWHECTTLDGVFIFCKKSVWEKVKFNETLLKGFHFYDLDFSLRASYMGSVFAVLNIDLIHYTTGGDYGEKWVQEAFVFHRASKELLPRLKNGFNANADALIVKTWLDRLKNQKIKFGTRIKWVTDQQLYSRPAFYYSILKFLFYRPLRLSYIHSLFK